MDSIVLTDSTTASTARIAAHRGFNCYEFHANVGNRTVDVIDSEPDFASGSGRPSGNGIPVLFPFPNRIREGKFRWADQEYLIPSEIAAYDNTGNAIHGFCLDRPWRVIDSGEYFVLGQFQLSIDAPDRLPFWPADFLIEIRYELRGTTLRADVRIANPDDVSLPWGFGTHPYFRLPLTDDSDPKHCLVEAPATEEWELIDCLPTGRRHPIPEEKDLREGAYFDLLQLDNVLTGLPVGPEPMECSIVDEPAGLQVVQRCDPIFRELVVFTPPNRDAVCLEPYTCLTDAVNLQQQGIDAGWRILEPGDEFQTWIEIEAGLVLA